MDIVQNVNHIFIILIVYVIKIQKDVQFKDQLIDVKNVKMDTDLIMENVFKILQD